MSVLKQSTELQSWLNPFSEPTRRRIADWLAHENATTVGPDQRLTRFRLDPFAALQLVKASLAGLSASTPIIWLMENRDNQGLDAFEVEAVVGSWMAIDFLDQANAGAPLSRIVVCGRTRQTLLAAAVHIALDTVFTDCAALARLALKPNRRVALVFMDQPTATILATARYLFARFLLLLGLRRLSAELCLAVPLERTETALADMPEEVEALNRLTHGTTTVRVVWFEDPSRVLQPERLTQAMTRAGIAFDCTLVPGVSPAHDTTLEGSYLRQGSYAFAPFDLRAPAALWSEDSIVELVRCPMSLKDLWSTTTMGQGYLGPDLNQLAHLLDFKRIERYFQDLESKPILGNRYHEFRIYNWPRPHGPITTRLFDIGAARDAEKVLRLLEREAKASLSRGSMRFTGASELLAAAHNEARERCSSSQRRLLDTQIEEHGYLSQTAREDVLRADLSDFVAWLPGALGETLEIGGGYGQLARTLLPRASRYVCIDLSQSMLDIAASDKIDAALADAHALPFRNDAFDTVIANNSLEHLYDPLGGLKEVRRVLRQGGTLYGLIPLDALNPDHEIRTHLWKADIPGIHAAVDKAGLSVVCCDVVDINALGVAGAFPSCNALVCKLHAIRPY